MRKWLFLLFVINVTCAFAQSDECGTRLSKKQQKMLEGFHPQDGRSSRQSDLTVREVGVVAHIVRKDNGTGGLTLTQLNDAMQIVNDYYAHANIHFFVAQTYEIHSSRYFDFNTSDESAMGLKYDVQNAINIYFTNSVGDNQGTYCGYAYFPGGPDRILMDNSCAINGSTLPHEIGHFFTLYHTHGKDNSQLTDELVNGSNCTTAGDEICDTPADPQLSFNNVNGSCIYTGSAKDANGDLFTPDPKNIMSYARKECRNVFTAAQYSRMNAAYDEFRSYLISKPVVADFDQNVNEICAGVSVQYTDESIGAQNWSWYFEGGTPEVSEDPNPLVLYQSGGMFDVRLIVTGADELADTLYRYDQVKVTAPPVSNVIQNNVGFEQNTGFTILNKDEGVTFQRSNKAASKGTFSAFMDFFNYKTVAQEDYLVLNSIDNTFSSNYSLTFDYAYTYYNQEYSDGLAVVYKADCDTEWTTLWSASGAGLATTAPQSGAFTPSPSQWNSKTINFELPDDLSVYNLAFKSINGYGNNLYIDNVVLNPTFETEVTTESCIGAADASITINIAGRATYQYSIDGVSFVAGNEFTDLSGGSYTVAVKDGKGRKISKAIVLETSSLTIEVEDVSCEGDGDGVATFDISGNDVYEFEVDGTLLGGNVAEGLSAGMHSLLTRKVENGCEYIETFEITEPEEIRLDVVVANPTCESDEGEIELFTEGGTGGYEYIVNGETFASSIIKDGVGEYEIRVVDANGCQFLKTIELVATFETPGQPVIQQQDGMLVIEETDFEINWFFNGELMSGESTESIQYNVGTYQVALSNPGRFCEVYSEEYEVVGLGVDAYDEISIAPNPVADIMDIQLPDFFKSKPIGIAVYTLSGMLVHKGNQTSIQATWEKGVYLVQIHLENQTVVRRVIKL